VNVPIRRPLLSVVAPAWNEAAVLPAFHDALLRVLVTLQDEFETEIVYVDDGSDDATPMILQQLASEAVDGEPDAGSRRGARSASEVFGSFDARRRMRDSTLCVEASIADANATSTQSVDDGIRRKSVERAVRAVQFIRLSRNFGHQAALTAGLEHARGDIVVSMDSDLQHPPAVIRELLGRWREGYEVVVTLRSDHHSLGAVKKLTSRLFYFAMRNMSGMDVRPAAADFRLLTRKALDALLKMPERHRFLRGMVHWLGFPTAEVAFAAPPRFAGKSKFTLVRMVQLARDGLLSFSRVPLHAALLMAGAMLLTSLVGTTITWALCRPDGPVGWLILALIAGGHLAGGAVWVALVAFSEYLARIHEQVLGRPLYVVESSSDSLTAASPPLDHKHRSMIAA
jgi:polyisoprenyl-phosphate glycosyltransferase